MVFFVVKKTQLVHHRITWTVFFLLPPPSFLLLFPSIRRYRGIKCENTPFRCTVCTRHVSAGPLAAAQATALKRRSLCQYRTSPRECDRRYPGSLSASTALLSRPNPDTRNCHKIAGTRCTEIACFQSSISSCSCRRETARRKQKQRSANPVQILPRRQRFAFDLALQSFALTAFLAQLRPKRSFFCH